MHNKEKITTSRTLIDAGKKSAFRRSTSRRQIIKYNNLDKEIKRFIITINPIIKVIDILSLSDNDAIYNFNKDNQI